MTLRDYTAKVDGSNVSVEEVKPGLLAVKAARTEETWKMKLAANRRAEAAAWRAENSAIRQAEAAQRAEYKFNKMLSVDRANIARNLANTLALTDEAAKRAELKDLLREVSKEDLKAANELNAKVEADAQELLDLWK